MIRRHHCRLLIAAAVLFACGFSSTNVLAQEPAAGSAESEQSSLFDTMKPVTTDTKPSDVRRSRMSAQEIRQARALYRANQRVARMEYNLWIGHEPLRPRWNSIPMMSSRYQPRKIYVPLFVPSR